MAIATDENLALFLATRQKRLKYWKSTFTAESVPAPYAQAIAEKLSTYALLLSKVARAKGDVERNESKDRLINMDREITSLFDKRRQRTSSMTPLDGSSTIVYKPR